MSTTRIMPGIANQEGRRVNTLVVGEMVSRLPLPRYRVTCERCGSETTESHERLNSGAAQCKAAGCGKAAPPRRDRLDDERRAAAEREAQRAADERDISARRMAAETDDYELPERFAPKPSEHKPMTERERQSLREFKDQQEAEQRAADAPRVEAERKAAIEHAERDRHSAERTERQRLYWRDAVVATPDPKLFVSPELANAKMPKVAADQFNAEQVQKFIVDTPDYAEYRTPENSTAILDYLDLNGVRIADAATYRAAFVRLRDLGVLSKKVAPEVKPASAPTRTVAQAVTPTENSNLEHGWDHLTGQLLTLNRRQVALLSADDYRRFKRLDKAALALPNHL